jgi:hypothetical protein
MAMTDAIDIPASSTGSSQTSLRAAAGHSVPVPLTPAAARQIRRDLWVSGGLFAAALAYATIRYNVFKGVPWPDWPAYTFNKALAVASLLIIVAAVVRLARRSGRTHLLLASAGLFALAHSLLSFALFNPTYFPRLFESGKLTFAGGLSVTLGAIVMAVMELGARRGGTWQPSLRRQVLALAAFAGGVHAALPAVSTWIDVAGWPGGLPPITLISFLAGTAALVALWPSRPPASDPTTER